MLLIFLNFCFILDLNRTLIVMAARPVVSVYGGNGAATGETINMPAVFKEWISLLIMMTYQYSLLRSLLGSNQTRCCHSSSYWFEQE